MTRVRQRFVDALRATNLDLLASKLLVAFMQEGSGTEKMAVKRTSKCGSLGESVAKLQDDRSIVLARDGVAGPVDRPKDLTEKARNIHDSLNGIRACDLVRRMSQAVRAQLVPSSQREHRGRLLEAPATR